MNGAPLKIIAMFLCSFVISYTKQGLEENAQQEDDLPVAGGAQTDNKLNCRYELMGIVVHGGTSDGGHYYSYIKERGFVEGNEPPIYHAGNYPEHEQKEHEAERNIGNIEQEQEQNEREQNEQNEPEQKESEQSPKENHEEGEEAMKPSPLAAVEKSRGNDEEEIEGAKKKDEWFECNDTTVRNFNISDVREKCFGGVISKPPTSSGFSTVGANTCHILNQSPAQPPQTLFCFANFNCITIRSGAILLVHPHSRAHFQPSPLNCDNRCGHLVPLAVELTPMEPLLHLLNPRKVGRATIAQI